MIENAYAMAAQPAAQGQGSPFAPLILLGIMFMILYVLMIRPQQKKLKEHDAFVASLERGDNIITDSGIHGEIVGLTDSVVTLQIADSVRIKMERRRVAARRGSQKDEA